MCELYADCSEAAASPTTATAKEHSTPFAIESAQRAIMDSGHVCVSLKDGLSEDWCYTACPNALCPPEAAGDCMCGMDASGVTPSPTAVSCLRVANHDFDRWFNDHDDRRYNWGEHPIRNATEADCSHACDKVINGHVKWCVDFEFRRTEMGVCELYADCSQVAASSTPIESARVAQAAPPKAARCLRLANHDFDLLFADQLDGSGNVGRRATEADCSKLCSDGSSEHWCIGFEFRNTEKGMCELYEDCSKKAATPVASETAEAHSTPFAAQAAQAAPTKEAPAKAASSGSGDLLRCLRVSDHDFDSSFSDQLDGSGNAGRRATKADCSKLCFDGSSEHHSWCVGFEFRDTEKGTCELYDECTPEVAKDRKEAAAKEVAAKAAPTKAAPPTAARCLRVSDHDFGHWFADAGRKAAQGDCAYACFDPSSEHHTWCIGFEFRDTETGMCELYDGCTQQRASQQQQSQQQQASLQASTTRAAAAPAAVDEDATLASARAADQAAINSQPGVAAAEVPVAATPAPVRQAASAQVGRCLRSADHDFDRWFFAHDDESGKHGRKATEGDCQHACFEAINVKRSWCVGFEFRATEKGTCELYDDCSEGSTGSPCELHGDCGEAALLDPAPSPVPVALTPRLGVARCLRVADHDFDRLFADQLDGGGNAGRKATDADCNHACFDASSVHNTWCVGFEFRETDKGTCELYDDCDAAAKEAEAKEAAAEEAAAEEAAVKEAAAKEAAAMAAAAEKVAVEKAAKEAAVEAAVEAARMEAAAQEAAAVEEATNKAEAMKVAG